ncbi:MAG TPA: hypothetical protein VJ604_13385, partial [Geomonas sp.]|nr:hypothetical protein [Geomonas sp.]
MLRTLSHLLAAVAPLGPGWRLRPHLGTQRCLSPPEGGGADGGTDGARQRLDRNGKERQILAEQVKQLYALAPIGFLATVINSVIVFMVMKTVIPYRVIASWLLLILVITAGRLLLVMRFRRQQPPPAEASKWVNRFVGSIVLSGAAWGSIGLFPLSYSIAHQVFVAFVLGGMAAGAASTFSNAKYGYAAFALPAMLPFAIRFILVGDDFHYAMGGMAFLYILLLWRISQHNCFMNRTSFLLRFENLEMLEGLRNAKEAVDGLNRQLTGEIKAKLGAEAELRAHHDQLEKAVEERTADLKAAQQGLV